MSSSLAALAGIPVDSSFEPAQDDNRVDAAVLAVSASMKHRGDLYRYTGVKPNHVHKSISD